MSPDDVALTILCFGLGAWAMHALVGRHESAEARRRRSGMVGARTLVTAFGRERLASERLKRERRGTDQ